MTNNIFSFKDIPKELILNAGGKGGMLSKMYQSGYPVPDGFVVLPDAFQNEVLNSDALNEIKNKLKKLRDKYKDAKFAVRSSALSEDSASASFAGEFETVLNVETDKEIESAIYAVLQSKESERVKSYSTVHNIIKSHKIAVVVQLMVQSEISGVLFTADPITGSFSNMVGNYVHGLGEQLVSGEADAFEFKIKRPKGVYEGSGELKKYHEYELSFPDQAEDEDWLNRQIEEFNDLKIDVKELLNKQNNQYEEAKKRFSEKFPNKTKWLENKLQKAAEGAQLREKARSEFVRAFRVVRSFALKAGEILELYSDIFFLYIDEIEEMLAEGKSIADFIPDRKSNYEKYKSMPAFPSVINGRFDPEEWVKNPERTMDYYDANMKYEINADSDILKGCAGASGRIEGTVRVLSNIEEGINLIKGEILVAATTNIGWTPLFPKAAAIVTDIGAPLSHAAIVARELGIPAVVGCGNATLKLKTGDRVIVDGGRGIVEIIQKLP